MELPCPVLNKVLNKNWHTTLHLKKETSCTASPPPPTHTHHSEALLFTSTTTLRLESSSVFCCVIPFTVSGRENRKGWESLPWNTLPAPSDLQGGRVTTCSVRKAAAGNAFSTEENKSLFKNKTQTWSYMNTYLLQVALWKAKSDKYKHYTELQASLPEPQMRCVLQRKQHNNIYNGRQSQINQLNFKTDLWSRNSKYNEQFQPYMF